MYSRYIKSISRNILPHAWHSTLVFRRNRYTGEYVCEPFCDPKPICSLYAWGESFWRTPVWRNVPSWLGRCLFAARSVTRTKESMRYRSWILVPPSGNWEADLEYNVEYSHLIPGENYSPTRTDRLVRACTIDRGSRKRSKLTASQSHSSGKGLYTNDFCMSCDWCLTLKTSQGCWRYNVRAI